MRAPKLAPSTGKVVVLDTAALIAGTDSLYALGNLYPSTSSSETKVTPSTEPESQFVTFYTVPEVVREVRDQRARARLSLLDGSIILRAPSAEAMSATTAFARATGNYNALSLTDMRVIALCWMLAVERGGRDRLPDPPKIALPQHISCGRTIPFSEIEQREKEMMKEEEQRRMETEEKGGWTVVSVSKEGSSSNTNQSTSSKISNEFQKEMVEEDRTIDKHSVPQNTESGKPKAVENMTSNELVPSQAENNSQVGLNNKDIPSSEFVQQLSNVSLQNANPADGKTENSASKDGMRKVRRKRRGRGKKKPNSTVNESQNDISNDLNPETSSETTFPVLIQENDTSANGGEENTAASTDPDQVFVVEEEEDDGIGWINEENLEEHLAKDAGEGSESLHDEDPVSCVTTDFAMQSTMLQMGLRLLSVDGRRNIRRINHFALRCQSCNTVTTELHRKFCESCGNASLHRVAYKIGKNGKAHAFLNPKKQPLLRGTKYSIPMPRGGRNNNDLILCEDQIDPVKQRRLQKQRERLNVDVLDPTNFYNAGARFNPNNKPLIVGYGCRNPNEARSTTRRKR